MGRKSNIFWKDFGIILITFLFASCSTEDAPDCFQTSGKIVQKEVELSPFEEVLVYDKINLFIEQGPEQKVVIESGKNLMGEVGASVENRQLILKNENGCNLLRDYNLTKVYVTVPNLSRIRNAGNRMIESVGILNFPEIQLVSLNQERQKDVYTNGDFKLHLNSENVEVTGDDFSNFFLSGSTEYLKLFIAAGDGRVEAQDLIAETVEVFHRGTNKVIVNPQQVLKGEIRSTGDVISVNRPPVVRMEAFYTGNLIFE